MENEETGKDIIRAIKANTEFDDKYDTSTLAFNYALLKGYKYAKSVYAKNTERVYIYPDRKLFGEYDFLSFQQLRIDIITGKITEQLCLIDSNGRASCFDEFAVLDFYSHEFICEKESRMLLEILEAQMQKRKLKR